MTQQRWRRPTDPQPRGGDWSKSSRIAAPALWYVVLTCLVLGLAMSCAAAPQPSATPASVWPEPPSAFSDPERAASPEPVRTARVGRPADSSRIRFVPERVILPGGAQASVLDAQTVDGELRVPENVRQVGWWDGSANVGDPFGSTVIAGHVDSATGGIGYFARLLKIKVGETVTVRGDGHRLSYRITSVQSVTKQALATDSRAFDQMGDHRLVLITCTGNYRPERGGYDRNLVVTGEPVGLAR